MAQLPGLPAAAARARRATTAAALLTLVSAGGTGAQVADVVRADERGDFTSVLVPGPRGSIRQRWWLVVDPDPGGLRCRDRAGRAWLSLRGGAVLESDPEGPPLLWLQGRPQLRVRVKPVDVLLDLRAASLRGTATSCLVRAHRTFLAPVQPDSLEALPVQRRKSV